MADLATPLTAQEQTEASGGPENAASEVNLSGPKVPNFVGKTLQNVMEEAAQQGVQIDLMGDGMARAQSPPAGALIMPGERVLVRFAR